MAGIVNALAARWSALRASPIGSGVAWNLAALVIAAACGLLLQIAIAAGYGAAPLGVFNQVFAWYVFASQIAVLGAHFSVLRHLAEGERVPDAGTIVSTGLAIAAVAGTLVSGLLYALAAPLGQLAGSSEVAAGIRVAAPGLCFFAINKVGLAALNGERRMGAFAAYQAARPVLLLACAVACMLWSQPSSLLPGILTGTELVLTCTLIPLLLPHARRISWKDVGRWTRVHLAFGTKSAPSGVLTELNTRVDVLILGVYTSDAVVGIYSFAAMLAEGVAQTMIVLRNNVNPYVATLLADRAALPAFIAKWRRIGRLVAAGACACGLVGYPVLVLVMQRPAFMAGYGLFALLLAGILVGSTYLTFAQTLMMGGRPGWHTLLCLAVVSANALLNLALVPEHGPLGAAIGTALAFPCAWLLLRFLSARVLGVAL